jgi:hypothetical protein
VPSGTYKRVTTAASPIASAEADAGITAISTVAEAVAHHRRRLAVPRMVTRFGPSALAPRRNRTHPCFSDREWADLAAAANSRHLKPGGYAAASTLLAARTPDPRAAIADTHRQLEELMESNRQLSAVGNNLNQLLTHLPTADALHDQVERTLTLVRDALDDVDTAATRIAWK